MPLNRPQKLFRLFSWIHPRTIVVMTNMNKGKVCEALEINRLKTLNRTDKMFKLLNRRLVKW